MSSKQTDLVTLASTAFTTSQVFTPVLNSDGYDIIEVICDLTAFTTTASLTLNVQEWVQSSGSWITMLSSTALTATGQKRLTLGTLVPTAANASLTCIVPLNWRVTTTHGNANSHTYNITTKCLRLTPKQS